MAVYDKPVRLLMKEMATELAADPSATFSKKDAVRWFADHYPKIKPATVTAHLIRLSTNASSRTYYNAKPEEDDVFYQIDGGHFRRYRPGEDPSPIHSGERQGDDAPVGEDEEGEEPNERPTSVGEFAYERDLRNYLAKNLTSLEPGLSLYENEGMPGVEFPVGGRFIDILAVDLNGDLVVIELKVSRGYDRVIGQLMRYVAWIRKNLAEGDQNVRGIIVAREISEDLILACSLVPEVELFEYQLSLTLKRVQSDRA